MTLSTSDTNNAKRATDTAFRYLAISILCAIFGAVYEVFSHEVYSFYMIYAFLFPLIGGTLPFLAINLLGVERYPGFTARHLYHSGIATLTIGSFVRGILDIYGTTNQLTQWYWRMGILLLLMGVLLFITCNTHKTPENKPCQ